MLIDESGDGATDEVVLKVINGGVAKEREHQGAVGGDRKLRVVFVRTISNTADLIIQGSGDAEVVGVRGWAGLGEVVYCGRVGEVGHLPWALDDIG